MKQLLINLIFLSVGFSSPQEWLKSKLELDGYSVLHYIGGNTIARVASSYTFWGYLGSEPPSNTKIMLGLAIITISWEMWEYDNYGGYNEWVDVYGSKREAFINAGVDIGLGMLGGLISLRFKKHKHKELNNEINYNPVRRTVVFTIRL